MRKLNLFLFLLGVPFWYTNAQTIISLQPGSEDGKDVNLFIFDGGLNHGDRESLTAHTWTHNGIPSRKRSFLEFDLSVIPETSTIHSAYLSLYYNPTDPWESFDEHYGNNSIYIQRITSTWDEHTIIWANQPSTTAINQVQLPPSISPTQDYLDIDVTPLVRDLLESPEGNHGFMIRMVDEINYYKGVLFATSDHSNANLHPKLVVQYEEDEDQLATASAGFDVSLCYNSSYTLSGIATNGTISWLTSGDGTFENESTPTPTYTFGKNDILNGNVTLTLIVTGSMNTAVDEMIITIKPEATAEAGSDTTVLQNIPLILSGNATNGSINWLTNGNGTFGEVNSATPTYTFGTVDISHGNVVLTLDVVGECNIATDDIMVTLIPTIVEPEVSVNLYPNPTIEFTTIEVNSETEFSIQMFNTLGQNVLEIPSVQSKITIDVTNIAAGSYFIRIINSEFLFIKKLIVHEGF